MQPPQTGTGNQTLALLSPQAPSAAAAAIITRGCSGPTAAQPSRADSTQAAARDKAVRPKTGGACASNAEISPTMKLVCTYSPAQPAWGNLSFFTKKPRTLGEGGGDSCFFGGECSSPHLAAQR